MIRNLRQGWLLSCLALAVTAVIVVIVVGCQSMESGAVGGGESGGRGRVTRLPESVPVPAQEPVVRVRVARAVAAVDLTAPSAVRITCYAPGAAYATPQPLQYACPLRISWRDGRFVIQGLATAAKPATGAVGVNWPALLIEPLTAYRQVPAIRIGNVDYPQRIALYPAGSTGRQAASGTEGNPVGNPGVDAINFVSVEQYLPGVLTKELYPDWAPEMYRAQAIAARGYAIYEAACSSGERFDLEAGQASQAYVGLGANAKAIAAVNATRGQVLTWQGRIFPAYYSSCTGGTGQDAYIAFPDGPNIPPLRGREQGNWDAESPLYRWGPVNRSKSDLVARFAAWGQANNHPLKDIRSLRDLAISARNGVGRPAEFVVTDNNGRRWRLWPEELRFACNYTPGAPGGGLSALSAGAVLRSSHVQVQVSGGTPGYVQFYDGRGFGHGVGMSQFGAQAMAARGYTYPSILAFYYPGAALQRAY